MSQFSDKARQVIATVAPLLGTALGGPLGTVAGTLLANALGTPPGDQKAAEAALLSATPDTFAKLKQAELDFQARMKELDISEEKLYFDDTANARAREIVVKDKTPQIIAYVVILLVLFAEGSMFFLGQPKNMDGVVLGRILGTLDSALMLVLSYYFGSSMGSAKKDSTISDLAKSP